MAREGGAYLAYSTLKTVRSSLTRRGQKRGGLKKTPSHLLENIKGSEFGPRNGLLTNSPHLLNPYREGMHWLRKYQPDSLVLVFKYRSLVYMLVINGGNWSKSEPKISSISYLPSKVVIQTISMISQYTIKYFLLPGV